MGFPLQREDVERHLKDLGYRNISDEQLDEFVKDLKRLIRYEEKQRRLKDLLQLRRNEAERKKDNASKKSKTKEVSPDRCSSGGSSSSGHFSSSEHELEHRDVVDRKQHQRQQHQQQRQQHQRQQQQQQRQQEQQQQQLFFRRSVSYRYSKQNFTLLIEILMNKVIGQKLSSLLFPIRSV